MSHTPARSFESSIRTASIGFALAALGTASVVHGQPAPRVIYVDAGAPAGGNGALWTSALRDLQDALFIANTRPDRTQPMQIKVAQGFYTPDAGTFNRELAFVLQSGVSLLGGFAGISSGTPSENDPTRFVSVLSGDLARNDVPGTTTSRTDNSQIVLDIRSQPGAVDGFSIRGGLVALRRVGYGTLALSRCTFTDNVSSTLNALSYDPYYSKQGIVVLQYANVVDCTFVGNVSSILPCIYANASVLFQRCTIAGNRSLHELNQGADPFSVLAFNGSGSRMDSCLFAANVSERGISAVYGDFEMFSCTLASNRSSDGVVVRGYTASLSNCILFGNVPSSIGVTPHQLAFNGGVRLISCSLEHGATDLAVGTALLADSDFISGAPGFVSASGPDGDPLTWQDNDYRLMRGSPCIDRGNATSSAYLGIHLDRRGQAPIDDPETFNNGQGSVAYLDLGCFEYIPNPCRADFNNSGTLSAQDIFDFLNAWFALSPAADFNSSGTITAQDIFDFLGAWFAGC